MKSLIVGTTSLYIGRVRNCATGRPRIPYFGTCLVRNDRTCVHLACSSLVWSPCCLLLCFSKNLFMFCTKVYSVGTWKSWNSSDELCIGCLWIWNSVWAIFSTTYARATLVRTCANRVTNPRFKLSRCGFNRSKSFYFPWWTISRGKWFMPCIHIIYAHSLFAWISPDSEMANQGNDYFCRWVIIMTMRITKHCLNHLPLWLKLLRLL